MTRRTNATGFTFLIYIVAGIELTFAAWLIVKGVNPSARRQTV